MTIPDMTHDNRSPLFRRKKSRLMKWVWRILLTLAILTAILFGVLSLVSGSSPELERGFESYLSNALEKEVRFDKLRNIEIFPTTKLAFEGLIIRPRQDKPKPKPDEAQEDAPENQTFVPSDEDILRIANFDIEVSFWDLVFGIRSIKDLTVEGVFLPSDKKDGKDITISRLIVEPDAYVEKNTKDSQEDSQEYSQRNLPGLSIQGLYGQKEFSAQIKLPTQTNSSGNIASYDLSKKSPFNLTVSVLDLDGHIHFTNDNVITLDELDLRYQQNTIARGNFRHDTQGEGYMRRISGNLESGESSFKIDIKETEADNFSTWGGSVVSPNLRMQDMLGKQAPIAQLIEAINSALKQERDEQEDKEDPETRPFTFDPPFFDITLDIKSLISGGTDFGSLSLNYIKNDKSWRIDNITGSLISNDIDAHYAFMESKPEDDAANMVRFDTSIKIRDLKYGDVQEALTDKSIAAGSADINIRLKSKGQNRKELRESLSGRLSLIAQEGMLASSAINKWGSGLINAILPKKDKASELRMNCTLVDFNVESGIAKTKTFFMDTKRVRVVGEGKIDFIKEEIDMILTPSPKDMVLIDVAPAVVVKGPVTSPSFSASKLSVGRKIGGLLLGLVNPAFLAVSMANFGVSDDHPCMDAIKDLEKSIDKSEAKATQETSDN